MTVVRLTLQGALTTAILSDIILPLHLGDVDNES